MPRVEYHAKVTPKQHQFITSKAATAIYYGGIGAGKTQTLVLAALKLCQEFPGIRIVMVEPTYIMLTDVLLPVFEATCPPKVLKDFGGGAYAHATADFGGGECDIRFRAFADPYRARGPTYGALFADEIVAEDERIIDELFERLRQPGMPCYARLATNSDSKTNWVHRRFIENPSCELVHTTTFENPFLPPQAIARAREMETTNPSRFARMVMGEWVEIDTDAIGAIEYCDGFKTPYRVSWVDPSFSNSAGTDTTAVATVEIDADEIRFDGKFWPQSISHPDVVDELLYFLHGGQPVESCLESQLSDSTEIFLSNLRAAETRLNLGTRNYWTYQGQHVAKHARIMAHVGSNKKKLRAVRGIDEKFLQLVCAYNKDAKIRDPADCLAGAIELWQRSEALQEFIKVTEAINGLDPNQN